VHLWTALANAVIAAQLVAAPGRQRILAELAARPWAHLPPPWALSRARSTELREHFEERAAIGEYERGMTRPQAELGAMVLTLSLMRRDGLLPAWAEQHYGQANLRAHRRRLRARARLPGSSTTRSAARSSRCPCSFSSAERTAVGNQEINLRWLGHP